MKNQYIKLLFLGAVLALAGCAPKVDTGGYVQDGDIKTLITVGQSTRDDVKNKLGSPSAQSSFGDEAWYYITNRKEAVGFLKPEIVEQNVTRIDFDSAGVVSKIEAYSKENGRDFALVKRTTPTEGHTLGFFEQILGNIGRFNRPAGGNPAAPGRKGGS